MIARLQWVLVLVLVVCGLTAVALTGCGEAVDGSGGSGGDGGTAGSGTGGGGGGTGGSGGGGSDQAVSLWPTSAEAGWLALHIDGNDLLHVVLVDQDWSEQLVAARWDGVTTDSEILYASGGSVLGPRWSTGMDANGNVMVIFSDTTSKSAVCKSRRFLAADGTWGPGVEIADDCRQAFLAVAGDGSAIAAWNDFGDPYNVYVERFSPGSGWEAAPQIVGGRGRVRGLAVNPAGQAILLWEDQDDFHIVKSSFFTGGVWSTASEVAEDQVGSGVESSDLVVDAGGCATIVFGRDATVYANRTTAGSSAFAATATAIDNGCTGSDGESSWARLAVDGSDGLVAVWHNDANVCTNRFTVGQGWGTAAQLDIDTAAVSPRVAVGPTGDAVAVWSEFDANDAALVHLTASRFSPGAGWQTPARLPTGTIHTYDRWRVELVLDSTGRALVAWWEDGAGVFLLAVD